MHPTSYVFNPLPDIVPAAGDGNASPSSPFTAASGQGRAASARGWPGEPLSPPPGLIGAGASRGGRASADVPAAMEWAESPASRPASASAASSAASASAASAPSPISATSATAAASSASATSASAAPLPAFAPADSDYQRFGGVIHHAFPMGRAPYEDMNGQVQKPTGRTRDTETVWTSAQILIAAQRAPIPPAGDLPLAAHFELRVEVGNPLFPVMPVDAALRFEQRIKQQVLHELMAVEDSITLRKLVRVAVNKGRLPMEGDGRWVLKIVQPLGYDVNPNGYAAPGNGRLAMYAAPFHPDPAGRVLTLPASVDDPIGGRYYLMKDGTLQPMRARHCILRALVCALTGARPTACQPWLMPGGGIDAARIVERGVGERGAVDCLAQRIASELDADDGAWLSPLPFTEENLAPPRDGAAHALRFNLKTRRAFEAIGGVEFVMAYVQAQDDYLDLHYRHASS